MKKHPLFFPAWSLWPVLYLTAIATLSMIFYPTQSSTLILSGVWFGLLVCLAVRYLYLRYPRLVKGAGKVALGITVLVVYWNLAPPRYSLQRIAVKMAGDNNFVARTLADVLADNVNAQHFGAVPDDGNDDAASFRKYRNWARKWGKNMYLTEGVYTLLDSVHHPGDNLGIFGRGLNTRIELRNASMRCGIFVKNVKLASINDLMIEAIIPTGTSTNLSGIEFQGSNFFDRVSGVRVALRNNNPGTNRGIWLNTSVSTVNETLWLHLENCYAEYWKYGLDGGQGGCGNIRISAGNYTQSEENIRLKGAGGGQINTAVGGFIGKIGVHLMDSCSSIDLRVFSEMITGAAHVAAVKIDAGANVNKVFLLNHGDVPAVIDNGTDNDIHITGSAPSIAGYYSSLQQYHKMPPTVFTGFGSQNHMNGAQYLENSHDSTSGNNRVNQRLVFQGKITAGGAIGVTGGISSFRRSAGTNTGGIRIDAEEYGPLTVSQFDVFGQLQNYGDVAVRDSTKGVIMKAPNGTCYRITVSNTPALVFTACTCPKLNK